MASMREQREPEQVEKPRKVVFLDRDGTMNTEVNYLHRPEDLVLIPGTAEAVRLFNEAGFTVIVVTNQAGVARGYYTEADVETLHRYLNGLLGQSGAHVDAFYYCPHHPEHGIGEYKKNCRCRKPGTGMFEAAERDLAGGIDRENSWMIGDKLIDTEAGHNFGIRSILVGTGYGAALRESQKEGGTEPGSGCADGDYDYYAEDLLAAARAVTEGRWSGKGSKDIKDSKDSKDRR